MPITDEQYIFIISLAEWNNPDQPNLSIQALVTGRLNLRPTLNQLRNEAISGGFDLLQAMMDVMLDFLTDVNNNEVAWFAGIEPLIRSRFG